MEVLTRKAFRVGNSAGVVVPKEWLNGFVEVKLVEPPTIIDSSNVLKILQQENIDTMEILGVAVTGSYARGEESRESDIDILVVTENLNKKINMGKYEIIVISERILKSQLENVGFPMLPMLLECKALLNQKLFWAYKKNKLSKKALRWLIDTTKSSIKISKEQVSVLKELGERKVSDNVSYSLILRLRTLYTLKKLTKNQLLNKKDFLRLVKGVAGSLTAYDGYVRIKKSEKAKKELTIEEAENLIEYLIKENKKIEKWIKNKENNF